MLNSFYQIFSFLALPIFKRIGIFGAFLVCLRAENLNHEHFSARKSVSMIEHSNVFHGFSDSAVRAPNTVHKQTLLNTNLQRFSPNVTAGMSPSERPPIYNLDSSNSFAFPEVESRITPSVQNTARPLDTTDTELLQILCQPEGPRNLSVFLRIPAFPIEVHSKTSKKPFLYLGNGVKYTETEGITLADPETETVEADEQLAQALLLNNYESSVNLTFSNMILVQQKIVSRRFVRVGRLYPKTPNGVDTDLEVQWGRLQDFLNSQFHFFYQLDNELKQWYYFVTIAITGLGSSVACCEAAYISLTRLPSPVLYTPLSGETMVILDIARVAAFCGIDGLHLFWKMIRCRGEIEAPNSTQSSLGCGEAEEESKFQILLNLCAVEDKPNLNRILFRRSHATLKDKTPGMVSMFCIPGSTFQNAVPPRLEEVLVADE